MKIGEILELLKTDIVANIAKRDDVHLSEKPLRKALNTAGYQYRNSGNKGWYFVGDGDEEIIKEKLIYDYSAPSKGNRKATANVSTKDKKETKSNNNQGSKIESEISKEEIQQGYKESASTNELILPIKQTNVVRKRSSFDLDVNLLKQLKIQAIIHDRNVYEMVEDAIKLYLNELKK